MAVPNRLLLALAALVAAFALTGCELLFVTGFETQEAEPQMEGTEMTQEPGGDQFPDVLAVELRSQGDRVYDVVVTLSSTYDTPQRYADGWRVLDASGNVLGSHTLMHDHAGEQPFTRTQTGLTIPEGVVEVTVQGRDQANGFGGLTVSVQVPES